VYGEPSDFSYFNGSVYVAADGRVLTAVLPSAGNFNVENQLKHLNQSHDDVSQFILFDSSQQQGSIGSKKLD